MWNITFVQCRKLTMFTDDQKKFIEQAFERNVTPTKIRKELLKE